MKAENVRGDEVFMACRVGLYEFLLLFFDPFHIHFFLISFHYFLMYQPCEV